MKICECKDNIVCKTCRRNRAKKGRITSWKRKNKKLLLLTLENKKKLLEIFGAYCKICGYNKCTSALHFHHKNPKEKLFQISSPPSKNTTFEEILREAQKCVLLCANCHAEVHAGISKI